METLRICPKTMYVYEKEARKSVILLGCVQEFLPVNFSCIHKQTQFLLLALDAEQSISRETGELFACGQFWRLSRMSIAKLMKS